MVRRKLLHFAVILSMLMTMVGVVLPTSVGATSLAITPPSVNFDTYKVPTGGQQSDTQSQPVTIRVQNTDPGAITITNVTMNVNPTDFSVTGNGCLNNTLSNGQYCEFSVVFHPISTIGSRLGSVRIVHAGGADSFVSLSGTAVSPMITFSPLVLNFGPQQQGTTSAAAQTITFENTGDGPVTFNFFTKTDPSNAYNVIGDTCSPAGIGPTQKCTVSVVFSPPGVGSFNGATVNFNTSAAGSPFNVQVVLNGTGVTPSGTLTPSSADFGAQLLNTFSAPKTFTITNTGNGPLTIGSNPNLAGVDATQFQLQTIGCVTGVVLAPNGGTCTFQVAFKPTSNGVKTATVNFPGLPGPNQVVTLNGTGVSGVLTPNTTVLNFGNQQVGTASNPQTVTITNTSGLPVSITNLSLIDTNAGNPHYEIISDGCSPSTLLAGLSCQVSVRFLPAALGALPAQLRIEHNGNGGQGTTFQLDIALNGAGIANVNNVTFGPTPFDFPATAIGFNSLSQTFTLTYSGPTTIQVTGATQLNGPNAADFIIVSDGCNNATLNSNGQCQVVVRFNPQAGPLGQRSAGMFATINGNFTVVALRGQATAANQAAATLTPSPFDFGAVAIGTNSASQIFTLTNTGLTVIGPLAIPAGFPSGVDAGDFDIISDGCSGATINPGAICQLIVRFNPQPGPLGQRSAGLAIAIGNGYAIADLKGIAAVAPAIKLTLTPDPHNFGAVPLTQGSQPQAFTLTNTGQTVVGPLVAAFTSGPDFAAFQIISNGCTGISLNPGATCQIIVRFFPTVGKLYASSLAVPIPGGGFAVASIYGTGVTASLTVTPNNLQFGNQQLDVTSLPQQVTIKNTSGGSINIGPIVLGGPDAANYELVDGLCAAASLGAGQECTFAVRFRPTSGGPKGNAFVSISATGVNGSPIIVALNGTGITPTSNVSPLQLNFGNQLLGTTSAPQTVTFTNGPGGSITLPTLVATGQYLIQTDGCSGATLAANVACTFSVVFKPTTAGAQNGTVTVGALPNPTVITLVGVGITTALNVSPAQLVFGPQPLGTASGPQSVTIKNTSNGPLTIPTTITASANFVVVGDLCSGATLPAGFSCVVQVIFAPTAPVGPKTGTLTIPNSGSANPITVSLVGTATAVPQGVVTLSPLSYNFGTTQFFTPTAPQTFTLTNNGTLPVAVTGVTLGGLNPLDFTPLIGNNCTAAVLNPGQSCAVSVKFRPISGTGTRTAWLEFNSDAPGSPHIAYLYGVAITSVVGINLPQLDFGNQQIDTTSGPKTLTLTNSTNGPLIISSVSISGQYDKVNDQCVGKTLGAGSTCLLSVVFKPTSVGPQSGEVTIAIAGGGGPFVINLYGIGLTPTGGVSPLQLNFPAQQIGSTSLPQTVTFTNGPGGPITLPILVSAGQYLIQTDGCSGATLAADAACTFSVVFKPTTAGVQNGDVTVGVLPNPTVITLNGVGVTSAILFAPQVINFGDQQVNVQSGPQTLTLINTSGGSVTVTSVAMFGVQLGEFVLTGDHCSNATLPKGGSCTIDASFKPTDQGPKAAMARFVNAAAGSPHDMPLLGNGVFPVPIFEASAVDFGTQVINTSSTAQTIKVTNKGPGMMLIDSVTITGPNAADFFIFFNNGCAGALVPNASCTVQVKFRPLALGARQAFLTFATNVAGNPNNVLLTGQGVPIPSYTVTVNTVGAGCTAAIAPVGPYQATAVVTLTAGFNPATTVFIGWTLDGNFIGFANPLTFTVGASSHNVLAACVPKPSFSDVNGATPYNDAIIQMAARGFIKGYGDGTYGPNDGILRAQMAGITVRMAGWSSLVKPNIFTDRCNVGGCVDDELWNSVAVAAYFQVARGYEDNTYRPFDRVANIQAVAFITRMMVKLGYWEFQPDNPGIYPNVTTGTGHREDIATYYHYAGAVPGTNAANAWAQWDQPSTRAYFAGIYWQAYASHFGVDLVP